MKKLEVILGILLLIGAILNLFLIPGSGIILTISCLSLSCLYFFGILIFLNIPLKACLKPNAFTNINPLRIIGSLVTGFALSTILIGLLFLFQSLPGSDIMIHVGVLPLTGILIISIIKYSKTKSKYYSGIILRISLVAILVLPSITFREAIFIDFKYRDYPDYIEALKEYQNDPLDEELSERVDIEREKMKND